MFDSEARHDEEGENSQISVENQTHEVGGSLFATTATSESARGSIWSEELAALAAMGFEQDDVLLVIQAASGNLDTAVEMLLKG
jgi:Holliday junction resolvasome RuvABC DNA-binding subunit